MVRNARIPVFKICLLALGAVAIVAIIAFWVHATRSQPPTAAGPIAALTKPADVSPTTSPTTGPAEKPRFETSYMEVVRAAYPLLPTKQPLAIPLELSQAARLVLNDPIYLSKARGDLWITRADAPPTSQVLKEAADPNAADTQTHVLRERVVFVHWALTSNGNALPYLVCLAANGAYEVLSGQGRVAISAHRDFRWDRAFSWDSDNMVVPSRTGISVFQFRPQVQESYRELAIAPSTAPASAPSDALMPQALFDGRGLLAWLPWEPGRSGSRGAVRYLDGKWLDLGPDQGWPERIVHLVPLRDGTVFQFVARDDGSVQVQTAPLEHAAIDEQALEKLVAQLSDIDSEVRRAAVTELANYGPGAWPALSKLAEDQPPQAKLLLRELLKDKNRPTLSGMTLLGERSLQLAATLSDGGVVFYAPQGVSIPEPNSDPSTTAPAWLGVRPGHYVELLPAALVADLKPTACPLDVVGDQWVADTDIRGPRLFYGNGFATLLRKDQRQFSRVVGMDQRGRWLFRKPLSSGATANRDPGPIETLVIDPHLPDPTPRLPVWNLAIAQSVGWDKDNWPVVENGAVFALAESDWRALPKEEKFSTRVDETLPATTMPVTTMPATMATTRPTTLAATEPTADRPLLTTADGTRYYDGLTALRVIRSDGKQIDWPLPPIANGTDRASLVITKAGKLFLFNQPGRVLRIAPSSGPREPFRIEGTFTRNIPVVSKPTRIWIDPAGRIDIAWENRLAILFPDGYIPRAISEKMLDQGGLDADPF